MKYECQVREQAAQPTLAMRTRTPVQGLQAFLEKAYGGIAAYLVELGQAPTEPAFCAYYNMDLQDLEVEAGFGVAEAVPGRGEILAGALPGGKAAVCLHAGPYDQMGPVYEALQRFMEERGLAPTGVAYEYYLDDPTVTGAEPHTEIVFPLKAA